MLLSFCVTIFNTSAKRFELNCLFSYCFIHLLLLFLHDQLRPLVTQPTPFLAEVSMSFCSKLLHFFLSFYFDQFLQIVLGNKLVRISVILTKVKYKDPHKTVKNSNFFLLKNVSVNCSDISLFYSIMIAQSL